MTQLNAIVGAYVVGAWIAALVAAMRWLLRQATTISGFLAIAGWAAVAVVCGAILSVVV
jgi:hypothetical protein